MQYTAFIGLHVYKDEFSNKFNRVHMRDDREYLDDKLDV